MKVEIRGGIPAEVRAEDDGTIRVAGYAAVFNEEARIGDMFVERIAPGAFRSAIGRDDVMFLVNHEGLPLARTRSGTLALSEDDHGLRMEAELDSTDPDTQRIAGKMKRGDLDKMSFAFWADRQEWDDTREPPLRTITEARLFDVSIVSVPAYDGTEIGMRALEEHRSKQGSKDERRHNYHARNARVRMKGKDLARKEREKGRKHCLG